MKLPRQSRGAEETAAESDDRKRSGMSDSDRQKVAVIGAGTMGNGIAHVFAQSGHDVALVDVNAALPRAGLGHH